MTIDRPNERRRWPYVLAALFIVALILCAFFYWPGWFKSEPVIGCTSPQWTTPAGDLEVFNDKEISPDNIWLCKFASPTGPFDWERNDITTETGTCFTCNEGPTLCDTCQEITTKEWEGDNFGPEMALPNQINNAYGAIAEIWDGGDYCALVAILPGETLENPIYRGAYWEATTANAVMDRFNHHRQEYLTNNNNCHVLESAALVP